MDNLTYTYQSGTNKLTHIDDAQTNQSAYTGDLEDQSSGNYDYDEIGNLIQDTRDSITSITWTNAQKIDSIAKTDRSIWFGYDAMQNRVVKHSKPNGSDLEKRTYYVRDAQGNVMATYSAWLQNDDGTITWDSLKLSEQHIYGSSRVGLALPGVKLFPEIPANPHACDSCLYPIFEGRKQYEISNHLGNVLAVITDRKRGKAVSGTAIQWFDADVVSAQQYYPFGMLMPGNASASLRRQYSLDGADYRFGFNTQEMDNEIYGKGNSYAAEYWQYDSRIGRRWNVDPKPEYSRSVYSVLGNNPIFNTDPKGDTLRAVNQASGKRALNIIQGTFNEMGMSGYGMAQLFNLESDGITFSQIETSKFNKALSYLSPEGQALAVGYYMTIGESATNVVEVIKRSEKISEYGQKSLRFARTGYDLDREAGGGHSSQAYYQPGLVNLGGDGTYAVLLMDSQSKIFFNDGKRPSLPGELLAHELIGHGLGDRHGNGVDAAIQATNMYLKSTNRSYYRPDHSPGIHSTGFDEKAAQTPPSFLTNRIPSWLRF